VELVTRVRGYRDEHLVLAEDRKFNERGLGIADEYFFRLFSFPLVAGDRAAVLAEPYTVAISHKAAKKYLGEAGRGGPRFNHLR
jgi:putative ABC transport system permease protein